jgi:hypothetical protein
MYLRDSAAVTFNGTSNIMKSNTAPINKGKSIDSQSSNLKFSVCHPGNTNTRKTYTGPVMIEVDLEKCALALCTWHDETDEGVYHTTYQSGKPPLRVAVGAPGTHLVPAAGCKMSKEIYVYGDMTIQGVSGSYHELQSNRVDHQGTASPSHRHFGLYSPGKLTLNYLKLTWGEVGSGQGGFIFMESGTLAINWVHFDGTKTTGSHARNGGCILVYHGEVTIKKSTFEGFSVSSSGGALYVGGTSDPMTIESTTFKDNEADVRFIFTGI